MDSINAQGPMSGRDIVSLLRNEARTKPAIAALIEQLPNMTFADIDAAKTPLPWYRKALKEVKRRQELAEAAARALAYADLMGEPEVLPSTGTIYRYNGMDHETSGVMINHGDLLFLQEGVLWKRSYQVKVDVASLEMVEADVHRKHYMDQA